MISVILVHTWHMLPFATVILLAGWTAIPQGHPRGRAVDGAGFFRTLFQITLPMLRPIINVALLFGIVFTFTDMTVIYILTRGGPYDTTQVLPSLAFFTGILGSDLAEGAAISLFLLPAARRRGLADAAHRAPRGGRLMACGAGRAGRCARPCAAGILAAFSVGLSLPVLLDADHVLQAERATSTTSRTTRSSSTSRPRSST